MAHIPVTVVGAAMHWVDQTPLWIIGLACLLGVTAAHEFGYQAGRRLAPQDGHTDGKSYLVTSVLSLVGLMMAFTFGAAQTDFRQRQQLVAAEANALGTAYLRIQTLDPPSRDALSRQMERYASVRGGFSSASGDPAALALNAARTTAEQQDLWMAVSGAVRTNPTPTLNGPLLQSVNEAFDIASSRRAAEDIRIPTAVLLMLLISGLATTAIVGFASSANRRYRVVTGAVLVVQIAAFCLILGLDRPGSKPVGISQAPMDRALAEIRQSEAAKR